MGEITVGERIRAANYLRDMAHKIENYDIEPIEFSLTRDNPQQRIIDSMKDYTYYPPYYTFKLYYKDNRNG